MNEATKIAEDKKAIFEYIKKNHGGKTHKIGVLLGLNSNGTIRIGFSKCNIEQDKFDNNYGVKLAIERAENITPPIPRGLRTKTRRFASRCVRYFKGANKLELPTFEQDKCESKNV